MTIFSYFFFTLGLMKNYALMSFQEGVNDRG